MRIKDMERLIKDAKENYGATDETHFMVEVNSDDGLSTTSHPCAFQYVHDYSVGPVKSAFILTLDLEES